MLSLTSIWNGVFNIIVYIDRGKLRKCEGWRKGDKWAGELESGRAIDGAGERKRHAELLRKKKTFKAQRLQEEEEKHAECKYGWTA